MNFFRSNKKAETSNNNDSTLDIGTLRETLFKEINPDKFNQKDIERLKKDDYAISRYIVNDDAKATIKAIETVLEWRKSLSLSDLKDEDFPEEFHKNEVFVIGGHDNEGQKIVYIRVKLFKKGEHPIEEAKKYLAYLMDRVDRETKGNGWALCFDCTDAGISNVDIELLRFIVNALLHYFVENCRYVLVFEMPWILSPIWKMVKAWLPQEQRDQVKFADRKDLANIIKKENQPEFLRQCTN